MGKMKVEPTKGPELNEALTDTIESGALLGDVAAELVNAMPAPSDGVESPLDDNSISTATQTGGENHAKPDAPTTPKKRGRPAGSAAKSKLGGGASQPAAPVETVSVARPVAGTSAHLLFTLAVMMGGKEWLPEDDEHTMVVDAFEQYYISTGRTDLPPMLGLCAIIGFYSAKRFGMPETQKRASGVFNKIKVWWVNRKLKKHGMQASTMEA